MVVLGVGNEPRDSYKTWKEGKVPDLVIEVVSRSTWRKDVRVEPPLYAALGIAEFWLFDPLRSRLGGFELSGREYREIGESGEGVLGSRVLGLDLLVKNGELRCRDPRSGKLIPDHVEAVRLLEDAERKLSAADREREHALRRVAELEALLRQVRPAN